MIYSRRKYNPKYEVRKVQYELNFLAFCTEAQIKSSKKIFDILPPTKTMLDPSNPNADYLWNTYLGSALWAAYPKQYLEKVLGLTMKGRPEVQGFAEGQMQKFFEYGYQGSNLLSLQAAIEEAIVKYGSCLLKICFPDDEEAFSAIPHIQVIPAKDVLDANEDFYAYKEEKLLFDDEKKSYKNILLLHVLSLDADGLYYEATLTEAQYQDFNFKNPSSSKVESLVYPAWYGSLTSIPVIGLSYFDCNFSWADAYSQPIQELSWHLFRSEADNRYALHQQSTAHLMIAGADPKQNYPVGLGAVHVFNDADTKEEFIAPPTEGIKLQFEKLQWLHEQADGMLLNLVSASNASGEALRLQIGDKTNALVQMVQVVGTAIQRISEKVAIIVGANPDEIEYLPYLSFDVVDNEQVQSITDIER